MEREQETMKRAVLHEMLKTEITLETPPNAQRGLKWLASQADHFAPWIVTSILAMMGMLGIVKAYYKPLWLDEIMGVLIAKVPLRSDIWAICKAGVDNQPPLYHYAMRSSIQFFGNDALGTRVPSLVGYLLFSLCLYWFVSRRASRLYGVAAMLFPWTTRCWYYATEGRPYGLMLGCAGIAAVCWQSIVMRRRRGLMLAGLCLSLTCALNLHYYAVLLFVPFGIAEAVRTYRQRKWDIPVWIALAAPLLVLLAYLPVIRAAKANTGIPYAPFARANLPVTVWYFAADFLQSSLVPLICLGVLYFVVQIYSRPSSTAQLARAAVAKRLELIPEAFLVLGFTCFPVFAALLSRFVTHIFFSRYAIGGIFGFALLLGFCAWLAFGDQKEPALALVAIFAVLVLHDRIFDDYRTLLGDRANPARVGIPQRIHGRAQVDGLPIVATNLDDYMGFYYYGDSAFRKRVFYVSSEELAKQYLGFTFHERMMIGSAPYFGTQVVDYNKFVGEHPRFYVFGTLQFSEWVVPKLMADGAELRLVQGGPINTDGGFADVCLLAQMPGKPSPVNDK